MVTAPLPNWTVALPTHKGSRPKAREGRFIPAAPLPPHTRMRNPA